MSGCGTGGVDTDSNVAGGKELFVSKCGSCHTLADAGTTGKVGPDLDAAFGPSREQGLEESTVRQVVRDQIHLPSPAQGSPGFPVMPANLVTGSDADAVSAYVASVAGVGAAPGPPPPPPPPPPPGPAASAVADDRANDDHRADAFRRGCREGEVAVHLARRARSCHSIDGSSGVGPTMKGLFGSKVELTNGKTVTADDAYLLEAIEDPDAEIVKGYQPGIMTSVIKPHQVAESDARDLIAYIKSLK